jgi:hypothetical protein
VPRPDLCPEAQAWDAQARLNQRSYGASAGWEHGLLLLTAVVSPEAPDRVLESVDESSTLRLKLVNRSSRPVHSVLIKSVAVSRRIQWHETVGDTAATVLQPVKVHQVDECLLESEGSVGFEPIREGMETIASSIWICDRALGARAARSTVFCKTPASKPISGTVARRMSVESRRVKVFLSYAHADLRWRDAFQKMLAPASSVELWTDKGIPSGSEWKAEIDRAMQGAEAGLFLISKESLASKFVVDHELPYFQEQAARGQKKLLWVAVSPSMHHATLGDIQCLNNPDRALIELQPAEIDREILRICNELVRVVKP